VSALYDPGSTGRTIAILVFVISLVALLRFNLNATWMILLGAMAGLAEGALV